MFIKIYKTQMQNILYLNDFLQYIISVVCGTHLRKYRSQKSCKFSLFLIFSCLLFHCRSLSFICIICLFLVCFTHSFFFILAYSFFPIYYFSLLHSSMFYFLFFFSRWKLRISQNLLSEYFSSDQLQFQVDIDA